MPAAVPQELWLSAAECARRIGLSVRTLRLYEKHGLIRPRRTGKQWRLYGTDDLARLNEVLVLKGLGLSLTHIARVLRGQPTDLGQVLVMQHEALRTVRRRADRGLATIQALQSKITAGEAVSIDDLMSLAKETKLTDDTNAGVAWRRYEQHRPRTEAVIDKAIYEDYAGTFQLDSGPFYVVSHRDDRLFTRVVGQIDIEIFPESETQFFMKALPVQVTFERDAHGQVSSLVHHQSGFDVRASRVDPELVKRSEGELERRIREKLPLPDSETIIRRVIGEHMRGEPDFDGMAPALAALAREQREMIQADLKRAGALKTIAFRGVGGGGFDIYDVRFENAKMEWGFALAVDGKISGLYLRPSP
jgi:DNA-binding transcriptional MerR regulator